MDVSSVAASISALSQSNVRAQASMLMLKKALDLQQSSAMQLLQALPAPVQAPSGATVGTRVDIFV